MTYCCGLLLREGLVMIADTRTNAGVDNISVFRKLHVVEAPDRCLAIATAGNLSVTQSVLSDLEAGVRDPATDEVHTLTTVRDMFSAAKLLGDTTARVRGPDRRGRRTERLGGGDPAVRRPDRRGALCASS